MQIHELNQFSGTPGTGDWLAIDDGDETTKIEMLAAVRAIADAEISSKIKNQIWYGTCSNAASTTAKTVTCSGFVLKTGETIAVKFTNTNTVAAPTLNVNGTGAISIKTVSGGTDSLVGLWRAGEVVIFTYDGTNWLVDSSSKAGVIVVSKSSVSSLSTTISDSNITSKHVVVASTLSNPAAQTGDWTVTTSNGSLSIAGSISGTTDITLVLAYQTN